MKSRKRRYFALFIAVLLFCAAGAVAIPLGLGGFGFVGALFAAFLAEPKAKFIWTAFGGSED